MSRTLSTKGVCRQLEGFAPVRLERERPPDAMHGRDRQSRGLGHRARTPVGRGGRILSNAVVTTSAIFSSPILRGPPGGARRQGRPAVGGEPLAPSRHRDAGDPKLLGDCEIGCAISRQKHDLGPHRVGTRYLPRRVRASSSHRSASSDSIPTADLQAIPASLTSTDAVGST